MENDNSFKALTQLVENYIGFVGLVQFNILHDPLVEYDPKRIEELLSSRCYRVNGCDNLIVFNNMLKSFSDNIFGEIFKITNSGISYDEALLIVDPLFFKLSSTKPKLRITFNDRDSYLNGKSMIEVIPNSLRRIYSAKVGVYVSACNKSLSSTLSSIRARLRDMRFTPPENVLALSTSKLTNGKEEQDKTKVIKTFKSDLYNTPGKLVTLYNRLKKGLFIASSVKPSWFQELFHGQPMEYRITWLTDRNDLYSLIQGLEKKGIIGKYRKWKTVETYFRDEEGQSYDSRKIRGDHHPPDNQIESILKDVFGK